MILTEVNFRSETLGLHMTMSVLLPQPSLAEARSGVRPAYPTLYLLHGYSDDHTAWLRWTSIERYAAPYNLAVVMPSVHLSFYTDMVHGGKYWQFISQEVPALARALFPLSARREDNFIAGLSMGGYGAFKLALAHPEQFAAAASLSGALDIREIVSPKVEHRDEAWLASMRNIFGDNLQEVADSKNDLRTLAQRASTAPHKPRLYQCCGTEDFLYQNNLAFRNFLRTLPFDLTYEEGPGAHDWAYWDAQIQKVLGWLPLA